MKNKTTLIRLVVVIGLLGAVVAFFGLGLQHQFSLDALKARQNNNYAAGGLGRGPCARARAGLVGALSRLAAPVSVPP